MILQPLTEYHNGDVYKIFKLQKRVVKSSARYKTSFLTINEKSLSGKNKYSSLPNCTKIKSHKTQYIFVN